MNYKCNVCKYETKRCGNYTRHLASNKHKNKSTTCDTQKISPTTTVRHGARMSKQKQRCKYCRSLLSRVSSLNRHMKICVAKNNNDSSFKKEINTLNTKIEHLRKKNKSDKKFLTNEMKHYRAEAKYFKYLFEEAGCMVKKSISSVSYIQQKYVDAPNIKPLSIKDLKGLEQDKKKLATNILYTYRHDIIDRYIGDEIIAVCLKEDPYKQFIWNTDASRFTYMIRDVINKVAIWQVDKGGRKTTKYLIDPIMKEIKELMLDYYKTECQIKDGDDIDKCMQLTKDSHTVLDIIENINDKVINDKILRYITPPLTFRRNLIK
jgi:hypothetical protein